jgi:glycosyltransferase involved in cell wall biosynthesis
MLVVIETHPIQYRAPVYQALSKQFGIPITVIYGSDYSVIGFHDEEFRTKYAWDVDLLSGYKSIFLSQVKNGGAQSYEEVSPQGLAKVLDEIAPTAVLITGYNHRLYQAAFSLALKAKYPILFRAETTDYGLKRNSLKALLRDSLLHWSYQRCAKLLYIGQNSKAHFQRLGFSEQKLIFSPYCINAASFQCSEAVRDELRQCTRQHLGIAPEQIVLLFSGKLSNKKRPDIILQAVKQLPSEIRSQIAVIFLGDGKLRKALENFAPSSPLVNAYFVGFQNQTQLSRYYHTADFLVLPSQYSETWGLVVNEALHHGLPAIVSQAVNCAPDLINPGVTGDIFETNSVESLATTIERLLPLVGRQDIRDKCRERVNEYSVEKAATGIAKAYTEITT